MDYLNSQSLSRNCESQLYHAILRLSPVTQGLFSKRFAVVRKGTGSHDALLGAEAASTPSSFWDNG